MPSDKVIASLLGGISQQAPSLRRPSQFERMVNAYPSIVEGLKKRPPTEHVAKIISGDVGAAKVHTIDRDETEKYKVVLLNGNIKVFDFAGNEKTVNFPDGTGYLSAATPRENFRCITLADYTVITNNTITCAMTTDVVATSPFRGIVFVKQAVTGVLYGVNLNGINYQAGAPGGNPSTVAVATSLKALIPTATWSIVQERSTLLITKNSGTDFTLKGQDPAGDQALKTFKNKVQSFTDLPIVAPQGYYVTVAGDKDTEFDDYYVKFACSNTGATFDEGVWKETIQEGAAYKLDASTMPHILVRESDGTFTFKQATYADRKVGDDNTNPVPSFVGKTITALTFQKDRLGFLADSNSVLSEVGEFFNFWRTTVQTLLDSDPIDVSSDQVTVLRHAVPFNKALVLFAEKQQFVLEGSPLLTPKTVTINPVTDYLCSTTVQPVNSGTNIYFPSKRSSGSTVMEFFIDPVSTKETADDVTAHVPSLIAGNVTKLAAANGKDVVIALADGDPSTMYAYHYHWEQDRKVQSSWSQWTFNGATILSAEFIYEDLFVVFQRADGLYLEKLNIELNRVDPNVSYVTHLDRRITEANCVSVVYNSVGNYTTFTLPYSINTSATYQVVSRFVSTGDVPGYIGQNAVQAGNTIRVAGDWTAKPAYIGERYTMTVQFSQQFYWTPDANGAQVIKANARWTLLFCTLAYAKTGYFTVTVDYNHRPGHPYITDFQGRTVDTVGNVTDDVTLSSGEYRFRIGADAELVRVTITNDSFLPCAFQTATWEGRASMRSRL